MPPQQSVPGLEVLDETVSDGQSIMKSSKVVEGRVGTEGSVVDTFGNRWANPGGGRRGDNRTSSESPRADGDIGLNGDTTSVAAGWLSVSARKGSSSR